jgi:hypothetical protein
MCLSPQLFTGQQPNDYQDYGNHKQYMYQRAYAWQSKKSHGPKQQDNNNNRQNCIHNQRPS